MKITLTQSEFIRRFQEIKPNHFSKQGLQFLFDYFEQLDQDSGTETEFDPINICVTYSEYDSIEEFWGVYEKDFYPDIEEISQYTTVIELDYGAFIIENF